MGYSHRVKQLAIAGLVTAGGIATGLALGIGGLIAILELDDGRHDIFGSDLPATGRRVQTHPLVPVR